PLSPPSSPTRRSSDLQVTVSDGRGDIGDVTDLSGEVAGHEIDAVGEVLPCPRHAGHISLTAELALGAHLPGHARHFRRKRAELRSEEHTSELQSPDHL